MKYENIGVIMLELVLERASLTTCGERLISKDCKFLQMSKLYSLIILRVIID